MIQKNVKLIELTHQDLRDALRSYQLDLLTDIALSVKQERGKFTAGDVAKLMMICSGGFSSDAFDVLLEKYSVPFIHCNDHELIQELYNHPDIFILPDILDSDEEFIVKVGNVFLDTNRIKQNI
jgi:hypothetical protein